MGYHQGFPAPPVLMPAQNVLGSWGITFGVSLRDIQLSLSYTGWFKKRKPTFGGHFEVLPGGFFFSVNIFVKHRIFYLCGEKIVYMQ